MGGEAGQKLEARRPVKLLQPTKEKGGHERPEMDGSNEMGKEHAKGRIDRIWCLTGEGTVKADAAISRAVVPVEETQKEVRSYILELLCFQC